MLDTISDLARERSSDKRRELLSQVADLFFSGAEHHTEQESVLFRDIVLTMLDKVEVEGRTYFSCKAAKQELLPKAVARKLAQDDVEVAGPMLQHSTVLTDDDFVAFSQSLPDSHLEHIAQRDQLSGVVTDALIENGNREVLRKVSGNKGAEITSNGFDKLVSNAADDEVLQHNLVDRSDVPEQSAIKLLPLLPEEGKAKLAKLYSENADFAAALVDDARKRATHLTQQSQHNRVETKLLILDVKEGRRDLSDVVIQLTEGNHGAELISLFSGISGLDEPVVSNSFYQANDEPFSILCKSIGVNSDAFTRLTSLRCEKLNKPLLEAGRAVTNYKSLSESSSKRAMRFVQMRNHVT